MKVSIERRARRHLTDTGRLLTIEARAKTGCLVTREVEGRVGKPENPDDYWQLDVGGITVFVRGTIETPDGAVKPSPGAVPPNLRVSEHGGQLTVTAR